MLHQTLNNLSCPNSKTAVALGTFDGVHKGHCAVLQAIIGSHFQPTVFAIEPPAKEGTLLTLPHEKEQLLSHMGVARYITANLSSISHLSPKDFFQTMILRHLNAAEVACGFNFRFGYRAAGDVELLSRLCVQAGIRLTVTQPVTAGNTTISSTVIRKALNKGDMATAQLLLGRPFGFEAKVVHGQHLGRTLGFPTLNQPIPATLASLPFGVYAVLITLQNKQYAGVCNVGIHPTVGIAPNPVCETYLPDYGGNAYGEQADIRFLRYLRPEITFSSLEELTAAIAKDVRDAKAYTEPYLP